MLSLKGLNNSINQAHPYRSILAKSAHFSLPLVQLVAVFLDLGFKFVDVHSVRLSLLNLFVQRKPSASVNWTNVLVQRNGRRMRGRSQAYRQISLPKGSSTGIRGARQICVSPFRTRAGNSGVRAKPPESPASKSRGVSSRHSRSELLRLGE